MIESPLVVPHEESTVSGQATVTTADSGAAGTTDSLPDHPVDAFFAASNWDRKDLSLALSTLNLVLMLINVWMAIQTLRK
ncbi:hypothetical protein CWS96_gp28 [Saline Natrinema sp. J7-1 virus 1]|uniref:Uncharacterized protein n=1 Tax=Saline Natrinema sp. J7-1 virus 1 TaxID=2847285 RepID=A0AAF0AI16_9VIRU|nr:hypothetical protein CWS96_gp28 [Saline Natrinema sp. J7-1 virus 1]WBE14032.1 hypothetical protein [Saline Natrinema sp. J7-1 virus 1]